MSDPYNVFVRETSPSPLIRTLSSSTATSRKRKRGQDVWWSSQISDLADKELKPIVIHPYSPASSSTVTFYPISIITRNQLPLAYLDTSDTPSRLFRANIGLLEPTDLKDRVPVIVLLVQDEKQQSFFAIERVEHGTYALCKIGAWVSMEKLISLASSIYYWAPCERQLPRSDLAEHWWGNAAVAPAPKGLPTSRSRKAPRLAICRPDGENMAKANTNLQRIYPDQTAKLQDLVQDGDLEEPSTEVTPEEMFESLITQYLDMLYCSKTSLAYFAKGPISRIRAAFNQPGISTPSDLANLLRTLILSSSTADKKYRDALPEALHSLPARDGEKDQSNAAGRKRKKKTKAKPDKRGMLPLEDEYFHKWWQDDESAMIGPSNSAETTEQQLKRRSIGLRTRETFMQIILILEITALEDKLDSSTINEEQSQSQDLALDTQPGFDLLKTSRAKEKKPQDLRVAMELLLDKLCIWHSLDQTLATDTPAGPESSAKENSNQLQSFCIEVIVPFYMSRISELAVVVNKKLGGPAPPSPVKNRSVRRKPAEAGERRSRTKQPRDPLQRVSSETMNHVSKRTPGFARSATDSIVIPGLKRERSETPLDLIPRKSSQPSLVKRPSALDKMRKTEVDLDALSQAQEAKKKKQAELDAKVQEAIGALKKPNRALAGKELADIAEQRTLMAQGRARTSQAGRSRHAPGVQIGATPKHNRTLTYVVSGTPQYGQSKFAANVPSSSSTSMVPSSSMRPPPAYGTQGMEEEIPQTGHRQRHASIEATPSRGPDKFAQPFLSASGVRPFSLAPSVNASVLQTPAKDTRTWSLADLQGPPVVKHNEGIAATPVKAAAVDMFDKGKNASNDSHDVHEETNIYDALGWND